MVFHPRCYVSSNRDHAARKFWWILHTASVSLCFIPVPGNQVWTYGKLTTLKMIHKTSISECCGTVSCAFSLEYVLFPLSVPGKNNYYYFPAFIPALHLPPPPPPIIFTVTEERRKRKHKMWKPSNNLSPFLFLFMKGKVCWDFKCVSVGRLWTDSSAQFKESSIS